MKRSVALAAYIIVGSLIVLVLTHGGILIALAAALYLVPALVAFRRHAEPRVAILLLNLVLGWTGLVWIALLIWAYQARRMAPPNAPLDAQGSPDSPSWPQD